MALSGDFAGESEAVVLFADRARQVDSRFVLDGQAGPGRMQSDSENPDAPAGVLYHGQDVSLGAIEKGRL